MKKIFLIILSMLLLLCGCGDKQRETTTSQLSDSCDMELCYASTNDGTVYQIVANNKGDNIEVGVIKNNEWLLEPTTDMPFVTAENIIATNGPKTGTVTYLGQGCFVSEKVPVSGYDYVYIFYNVETGLSYSTATYPEDQRGLNFSMFESESEDFVIATWYSDLVFENGVNYKNTFVFLDKETMKTYDIYINSDDSLSCRTGVSEGLFAVYHAVFEDVAGELELVEYDYYFYDLNGNLVIDLSQYDIDYQELRFINGKCTFTMNVNFDGKYEVTINKTGKIINTVKQ